MVILGIETSCDETGAAVLKKSNNRVTILSNVLASSAPLQAKYGGVIPEQAAREQIKAIIPVIQEALQQTQCQPKDLDAIAVAYGPGLIGSLLVGVETAKTLALVWNKPLIPVNHLIGHFYANWITHFPGVKTRLEGGTPKFPCLGLLVSGGHTDLVLFKDHGQYEYLGGTRDDAAGECFDKCARLLGLPYPGGPEISKLATKGDAFRFALPRPMIDSGDFDFSFSGLKTAVANLVRAETAKSRARKNVVQLSPHHSLGIPRQQHGAKQTSSERSGRASGTSNVPATFDRGGFFSRDELAGLCASIEAAIVDVLVAKTIKAAQEYKVDQIMVAGGVAANQSLVRKLKVKSEKLKVKLHIPPPDLCTDNAAMIASAALFQKPIKDPLKLQADPNLSLA